MRTAPRLATPTRQEAPHRPGKACPPVQGRLIRRCQTDATRWIAPAAPLAAAEDAAAGSRRPARAGHAAAHGRAAPRSGRRSWSGARGGQVGQGRAAAAAEGQAPDHVGVDARVRRRLRADLGLAVRGRLRRAAFIHEMGHYIQLRREGVKPSGMLFIPFLGAAVGTRSLGGSALAEARVGLAGPVLGSLAAAALVPDRARDRRRVLARARVHRLLPQPLQPAAGGAARRRPRDGRDGAVDVVRRLRRDGAARSPVAEPDPVLILLLGGLETYRRWKERKRGDEGNADYYRVRPRAPRARRRRLHRADRRAGGRHGRHARRAHVRRRLISRGCGKTHRGVVPVTASIGFQPDAEDESQRARPPR